MGTTPGTALEAPPETPGAPLPVGGEQPQEAQPVETPAPPSVSEALGAAADATEATFEDEPEVPETPLEAKAGEEASEAETPEAAKAPETTPPEEPEELTFADETPEPSGDVEPLRALFATGDPNLDDPKTADAIRGAFLKTKSGQNKLLHFQASQKLAEPSNDDGSGGIGYSPDFEDIKGMYEAREDLSRLESDFEDPSRVENERPVGENWLDHWFSPQDDGNLRPGADKIITAMPQFLAQNHPQLHRHVGNIYGMALAAQFLDEARGERDETTRESLAYMGKNIRAYFDGKNGAVPTTTPGASNPEMDRLRYERDQAVQHADGVDKSNRMVYENQVLNSLTDATRADVEEGFKSLKGQYSEYDFDKITSGIADDVYAELNKDPYYAEGLAARIANSYDHGGMNSLAGAQTEHRARRREVIKRIWRDRRTGIPKTNSEVLAESKQRHDQLQNSQEAGDLAPGGKASPRMSVVERAKGETQEQHINRAFDRANAQTYGGR